MTAITREVLRSILSERNGETIDLAGVLLERLDLRGFDFHDANLSGASFKGSDLEGANLRGCNLTGACIEGANMFCANLEQAVVEGVRYDGDTRYFEMRCPAKGAFLGYKKCYNFRIVQLLIPAEARRVSATGDACRCDRAKVLTIKSPDLKTSYNDASAFVDDSFIYRVGQMVYSKGFCEDRWCDSSPGIHFYLTRKEALGYL